MVTGTVVIGFKVDVETGIVMQEHALDTRENGYPDTYVGRGISRFCG